MLAHLSEISPYVCDLNRGSIEPANRMSLAPTKKNSLVLLGQKDSCPKMRAPLKLLDSDEVPMDSTTTTTDINASLQPVWYTEQTIVDNQPDVTTSIIQEKSEKLSRTRKTLTRSTLPSIKSDAPVAHEEREQRMSQPSLMKKSSTFIIESSMNLNSILNDSEKENVIKDDTQNPITPPSDDSFRALEHLLGLGSSTTTIRESPKTNHDTLSLTAITPTDIINSTSASLRMSYAPKGMPGSLPSSQDIPQMSTIESINSTNPPSIPDDKTQIEDDSKLATINQQNSFNITDENNTMKDDTDFSFELNDFSDNTKSESTMNVPERLIPMRAPTCTDVAYRALVKPRSSRRISQPVKVDSPLAKSNKLRSSAPISRILRSSCRRLSTDSSSQQNTLHQEQSSSNMECFVNNLDNDKTRELFEIVSLPEEDENEQEKPNSITLNMSTSKHSVETSQLEQFSTPTKSLMPILSHEYTYNTPKRRSSQRRRTILNSSNNQSNLQKENEEESINSKSMLNILLTNPTEQEKTIVDSNIVSPSLNETNKSPSINSNSMLNILLTKPTDPEQCSSRSSNRLSRSRISTTKSPSIASKSMLGILLTKPTDVGQSILQETLTPSSNRISTRQSKRISSNPTPRGSINPLHSSTPSISEHKSLQIVSIGPEEQVSTTVPQQINVENQQEIESFSLNHTKETIKHSGIFRTNEIGVQTTPSLNSSTRRILNTIEPQTTPTIPMNNSSGNLSIIEQQQQITPTETRLAINVERNVRFQLTPTTDARLTAKEIFEENLRGLKPDIILNPIPVVVEPKHELSQAVQSVRMKKRAKPKKKASTTNKKKNTSKTRIQSSEQSTKKKPLKQKPIKQTTATENSKKIIANVPSKKLTPTSKASASRKRSLSKVAIEPIVETTKKTSKKRSMRKVNSKPIVEVETRTSRKRSISKVAIEPSAKRPKVTTKSIENKPSKQIEVQRPSLNARKTRSGATFNNNQRSESIERQSKTRNRSTTNKKNTSETVERPQSRSNNKQKINSKSLKEEIQSNTTKPIKTRKQRLEKVETKKDEQETIPLVQNHELNAEERKKIEALTVAKLKSRLNSHKEDIPKSAKKADLIALLIKIETNLIKKQKETETITVKTTRHCKK